MLDMKLIGKLILALVVTNFLTIGLGSIVFGSDWPQTTAGQQVRWIVNAIPVGIWAFVSTLKDSEKLERETSQKAKEIQDMDDARQDGTVEREE